MAFGDVLGTDGNQSTSPGTGISGAGLTVAAGDLVVVAYGMAENPGSRVRSVQDTLTNTWTALDEDSTASGSCIDYWYSLITNGGSTTISTSHTSTTADAALSIVRFEGPFTGPLDKNPTSVYDAASQYDSTSSGTLTQADELVVGFLTSSRGLNVATSALAAVSPATLQKANASGTGSNTASAAISSWVVSSTSAVTASFTANTDQATHAAVATFKKDTGGAPAGQPTVKRAGGVGFMNNLGRISQGIKVWFEGLWPQKGLVNG